jgi:hypothetical protein
LPSTKSRILPRPILVKKTTLLKRQFHEIFDHCFVFINNCLFFGIAWNQALLFANVPRIRIEFENIFDINQGLEVSRLTRKEVVDLVRFLNKSPAGALVITRKNLHGSLHWRLQIYCIFMTTKL